MASADSSVRYVQIVVEGELLGLSSMPWWLAVFAVDCPLTCTLRRYPRPLKHLIRDLFPGTAGIDSIPKVYRRQCQSDVLRFAINFSLLLWKGPRGKVQNTEYKYTLPLAPSSCLLTQNRVQARLLKVRSAVGYTSSTSCVDLIALIFIILQVESDKTFLAGRLIKGVLTHILFHHLEDGIKIFWVTEISIQHWCL